ncbi:MAG: L-lactate dehydrogenase [Gammaproteobacteria bacterium]
MLSIPAKDYRELARKRLPKQLFDYIDGGSYDERTLAEHSYALSRIEVRQKVLVEVSDIDFTTSLLGTDYNLPLALAPVGLAGSFARRGEVQAVKAADKHNIPFCLSTLSICSMEEIAEHASKPFWYQLYMIRERSIVTNMIKRAAAVGCETLILTVDLPFPGARYRDVRNGMYGDDSLWNKLKRLYQFVSHPRWLYDVGIKGGPVVFGNLVDELSMANSMAHLQAWVSSQFDPSVSWQDLAWVREQWQGKLIIKGVMTADDARLASEYGVDGIIVSNHGGRQLDTVPATINAIEGVVQAAGTHVNVMMDSGIRSGLDILKARAMGADGCLIGRAWVYALAARGEEGVDQMLTNLKEELRIAMALTGNQSAKGIARDSIIRP